MSSINRETRATRARYERIAPFYDLMELLPEARFQPWRERLWAMVEGPEVLEVGVGTGKNIPFYPSGTHITAIDLTPGMLERAKRKADKLGNDAELLLGDAQALPFKGNSFNTIVATCVFCSVPDPILGLREILRVIKPGGTVLFIEHVRSRNPVLGTLMDIANPLIVRTMGPNINRRTVENVRKAGLCIERVEGLGFGNVFKLIIARKKGLKEPYFGT